MNTQRTTGWWDTTPGKLTLLMRFGWVMVLVCMMVVWQGADSQEQVLQALRSEAAPAIVSAQELAERLAALDNSVGEELLWSNGTSGPPPAREETARCSKDVLALLLQAGYVDNDKKSAGNIQAMLADVNAYMELVGRLRLHSEQGDRKAALQHYQQASLLLHQKLLPAAHNLDAANAKRLEHKYQNLQEMRLTTKMWLLSTGLALLGILIGTQFYMQAVSHRKFSIPLLAALAISLVFLMAVSYDFNRVSENLRVAHESTFKSMHALYQARATMRGADGVRIRWQLQPASADQYQKELSEKLGRVITVNGSIEDAINLLSRPEQLKAITSGYLTSALSLPSAMHRDQVMLLQYFQQYCQMYGYSCDSKMESVWMMVPPHPSSAKASLEHVNRWITANLQVASEQLQAAVNQEPIGSGGTPWLLGGVLCLLLWCAVQPRLKEYHG